MFADIQKINKKKPTGRQSLNTMDDFTSRDTLKTDLLEGKSKKVKGGLAMSVLPGTFVPNTKKKTNFAQSVGFGLLQDVAAKRENGILGSLADDANLPDEGPDHDRDQFNCSNFCELCDRTFAKLKGINRHHCRKCNKSVCQQCSNNKRKLSKQDETLFRVCDFCDTHLSNYKLEQNQLTILKA